MRDKAYLRSLLDYNAWANTELYARVRALPPDEVTKKRRTGLESIHLSLNHLRDHGIRELRARLYEDFDALAEARRAMDRTLVDYLETLDGDALEEVVTYTLIGGNTGSLSRAMCFTHLVVHGAYHRGWIADMFGQAETQPAVIDIPVYERAIRAGGLPPLP
jgi:uncharacterized damage-inducible protein DinB